MGIGTHSTNRVSKSTMLVPRMLEMVRFPTTRSVLGCPPEQGVAAGPHSMATMLLFPVTSGLVNSARTFPGSHPAVHALPTSTLYVILRHRQQELSCMQSTGRTLLLRASKRMAHWHT